MLFGVIERRYGGLEGVWEVRSVVFFLLEWGGYSVGSFFFFVGLFKDRVVFLKR